MPFGFDVEWYCKALGLSLQEIINSQLPFGFDVEWYHRKKFRWHRVLETLNCLSALMSNGIGLTPVVAVARAGNSQLPFGFDVEWYYIDSVWKNKDVEVSQLPFGFDVEWYGGTQGIREAH